MQNLTNIELHDAIAEHSPKLAQEVMRRLNRPVPVDMDQESQLDRLKSERERILMAHVGLGSN